MGQLLSTDVTCDPSTSPASGLYYINGNDRTFEAHCQQDTTGPVLAVTTQGFYDCITTCIGNTQCEAISWNQGTCYQKSAIGSITANQNVWTFIDFFAPSAPDLSCTPSESVPAGVGNGDSYSSSGGKAFTVACATDWPGVGDLSASQQPTFESCMDDCSTTDQCVAVVYSGTGCYKKSSIGNAVANSGVRAAYLTTMPTPPVDTSITCPNSAGKTYTPVAGGSTYSIQCGVDYFGGDLTSQATNTFEDCIAACESNPQCVDVSYNYGSCYLKSTLTTLQPNPNVWTAQSNRQPTVPSSADPFACPGASPYSYTSAGKTFEVDCATDYFGGDFTSLNTDTMTECIDACAANSECVALSYRGTGCYLKSTATTPVTDSGVRGAKVAQAPPPVVS